MTEIDRILLIFVLGVLGSLWLSFMYAAVMRIYVTGKKEIHQALYNARTLHAVACITAEKQRIKEN